MYLSVSSPWPRFSRNNEGLCLSARPRATERGCDALADHEKAIRCLFPVHEFARKQSQQTASCSARKANMSPKLAGSGDRHTRRSLGTFPPCTFTDAHIVDHLTRSVWSVMIGMLGSGGLFEIQEYRILTATDSGRTPSRVEPWLFEKAGWMVAMFHVGRGFCFLGFSGERGWV